MKTITLIKYIAALSAVTAVTIVFLKRDKLLETPAQQTISQAVQEPQAASVTIAAPLPSEPEPSRATVGWKAPKPPRLPRQEATWKKGAAPRPAQKVQPVEREKLSPYNVIILLATKSNPPKSQHSFSPLLLKAILHNTIPIITAETILAEMLRDYPNALDHWTIYRANNNSPNGTLLVLCPPTPHFKPCAIASDEGLCGFNKSFLTKIEYQHWSDLQLFNESSWSVEDLKRLFDTTNKQHGPWSIYLIGHGSWPEDEDEHKRLLAGLIVEDFKSWLTFLQKDLSVSFFYYISCFSGGKSLEITTDHLMKLREQEKKVQKEANPDFIVVAGALIEAPATASPSSIVDNFDAFFSDIQKFLGNQGTFSEDPFKTILRNLYDPSFPQSIVNLPSIFLPGQLAFSVVNIDKNVILINQALNTKHVLEKKPITTAHGYEQSKALLFVIPEITATLNLNRPENILGSSELVSLGLGQPPLFISLTPGITHIIDNLQSEYSLDELLLAWSKLDIRSQQKFFIKNFSYIDDYAAASSDLRNIEITIAKKTSTANYPKIPSQSDSVTLDTLFNRTTVLEGRLNEYQWTLGGYVAQVIDHYVPNLANQEYSWYKETLKQQFTDLANDITSTNLNDTDKAAVLQRIRERTAELGL